MPFEAHCARAPAITGADGEREYTTVLLGHNFPALLADAIVFTSIGVAYLRANLQS